MFVYYSCSQNATRNQHLSRRTALVQYRTQSKYNYTTKHNTRFSTGILSSPIHSVQHGVSFTSMP